MREMKSRQHDVRGTIHAACLKSTNRTEIPSLELLRCGFKTLPKFVNTSAGINKLLLTGEERMALRAYFNSYDAAGSGTGLNFLAASAPYRNLGILRMDTFLHCLHLPSC